MAIGIVARNQSIITAMMPLYSATLTSLSAGQQYPGVPIGSQDLAYGLH